MSDLAKAMLTILREYHRGEVNVVTGDSSLECNEYLRIRPAH